MNDSQRSLSFAETMELGNEKHSCRPWSSPFPPRSILLIRFHALGDVALTIPFAAWLRRTLPDCRIDCLTMNPDLLRASGIFSHVIPVLPRDTPLVRVVDALSSAVTARGARYDIVIDLQRNRYSRLIRHILHPSGWAEFDRFSPASAASRTAAAFVDAGFPSIHADYSPPIPRKYLDIARNLLETEGWNGSDPIVVLNPAGLWPSRNWPIQSYVDVARILASRFGVRILLLGTSRIREQADYLEQQLGALVLNLCGRTEPGLALAVLRYVSGMVTEDSGLTHMAWALKIPMVALFGSSYHVWSAPTGEQVRTLHSGDLPCGACMEPNCRFGDTHCLTRWTPDHVAGLLTTVITSHPPRTVA